MLTHASLRHHCAHCYQCGDTAMNIPSPLLFQSTSLKQAMRSIGFQMARPISGFSHRGVGRKPDFATHSAVAAMSMKATPTSNVLLGILLAFKRRYCCRDHGALFKCIAASTKILLACYVNIAATLWLVMGTAEATISYIAIISYH